MTTYSVGPITLWTRLPKNQIHTLRHLNQLPGVYRTWNRTSVFPYQKNGILRFEITPFYNHFTEKLMFAHLKIMIDPLSTAESDLPNPEIIQNVLGNTFDRLYHILPDEIFDTLQVSQINFKGNLQMETQIQAEEYVALLYKGNRINQIKSYYFEYTCKS